MPAPSSKAVFLSYAREDAEAARRIADALRGFGVEIWFDSNELRGGDAWDQKIRRQIRECALFIPVISSGTQTRNEGYFRLEWRLAVERSHLMVSGAAFLVPVVIDATPEEPGMVPDEFLKVQWTRLPGGAPTPQFVSRIQSLLTDPSPLGAGSRAGSRSPMQAAPGSARAGFPAWAVGLLVLAVAGLGVAVFLKSGAKPEPPSAAPSAAAPVTEAVNSKSLAVLPFTNMSAEKDSSFFTDGIQEDILTNLALISDLHVVSRTSVMQYRDTEKPIKQIGRELGVAYVLEGSVQREGNKVRVTGQLINARTDEHVWAKAYDRDVTDIFAIQAELATEIAGALQAAITPQQKNLIDSRGTSNVEAYSSYLKARELRQWSGVKRATLPEIDMLLQSAVTLDPKFWEAWLETARINFFAYGNITMARDRSRLEAGRAALAEAIRLAPQAPKIPRVQALEASVTGDVPKARSILEHALALYPGDAELLLALGGIAAGDRQWAEAMGYVRRALTLDPRNPDVLWSAYFALLSLRQWDQALATARLLQEIQPDSLEPAEAAAMIPFMSRGSTQDVESLLARMTPEQRKDRRQVAWEEDWYYHFKGDAQAYIALCDSQGTDLNFNEDDATLQYAEALIVLGDNERAKALVAPLPERLKADCARDPDNYVVASSLAYAQALLGQHDEAMATIARVLAMYKPGDPSRKQFFLNTNMAIVYGWLGEKDRAVDITLPFMGKAVSRYLNVESMRHDIDYWPMHGFKRWEDLLNDPENKHPLSY